MPENVSKTSSRFIRNKPARYIVAVAAVALAVLFREALGQKFGALPPYVTYSPALILVALLGDMWAGLLATVLSALAADYLALPPRGHFAPINPADAIGLATFCVSAVSICVITEFFHRNREKLAAYQLEEAVQAERAKSEEVRKVAEAASAERKRFYDVLETVPQMISLLTPDCRVVFANHGFREKYGEPDGRHCYEARFGRDEPCTSCETFTGLPSGELHRWEFAHPDGALVEICDIPFTDVDGSPLVLKMEVDISERRRNETQVKEYQDRLEVLISERTLQWQTANAELKADIAQREKAEDALLENQERLRVTLASIADAVMTTDTRGHVTYLNPVAGALTGWNPGEAAGKPIQIVFCTINEQTREPAEDVVSLVLKDGRAVALSNHTALLSLDGREIPIEDSAAPILDAAGKVLGVVLVFHDVTQRRRALEAMRHASAIVDSSADAILGKTLDGVITSWNRGAEHLYGYSAAEMIGQPVSILIPVELRGDQQIILESVVKGERVERYETVRKKKDGALIDVSLTVSPIVDGLGKVIGASAIARDISERKRAEEALLRSEKLASVGRMAASISHEINNPLEAVTNTLYLARLNAKDPDTVCKFLDMADDELARIAHITRQTLGFYRETTVPVPVSVNSVLDSAIDVLRGKIKKTRPRIDKQYDGDLLVTAIPGELRQVFANLLGNSMDALGSEGVIKLRVSPSTCAKTNRARVRVTVADNGHGIGAANLKRVFEPLFTTKGSTGTGLGLWVASQIIEKHGGSIQVRSRTTNGAQGTAFSVVLPVEPNTDGAKA